MADDAGMKLAMKRVLAGCLTVVAAAVPSVLGAPPGFAAICQRTVVIQPEVSAGEGAGRLTFVVRSYGCPAAGDVRFAVEPGTAQPPGDFASQSGRLKWGAGEAGQRSITVTITDDTVQEPDLEHFTVRLFDPSQGILITGTSGRGRILDEDDLWLVWVVDDGICDPDDEEDECECLDVHPKFKCEPTVNRSSTWPTPVTIHWSTVDGSARAGVDFVGVTNQVLTVPAGATHFGLPVQLLPQHSPGLQFGVRIFTPSVGLIADGTAVVTIGST
jgi:Calx-beta domain-containing protein